MVRTTHHGRHIATHRHTMLTRAFNHRHKTLYRFVYAAIDVFLREGFRSRGKHRHLGHTCCQGSVQAFQIGREHGISHPVQAGDLAHHFGIVGHLRHPFGRHKSRCFDGFQAACTQARNQFHFGGRVYRLLFVLQAIAWAYFNDFDVFRQIHRASFHSSASNCNNSSPSPTWSPTANNTCFTTPSLGAVMVCSIFIASNISKAWPFFTV